MTAEAENNFCLLSDNSVVEWQRHLVREGVLCPDAKQESAVQLLQNLANDLMTPSPPQNFIRRFFAPAKPAKKCGLYLHGGVGRGKTFLMDGFYLQLPTERKLRVHFHQFMRHFHADMKKHQGHKEPLWQVADDIARDFDIVCFDEFHISDITDAMILGRLLARLLDGGVRLVMTSNYAPDKLYPNGLARERFLPTIDLLRQRLEIFSLDKKDGEDYRMRHLQEGGGVFFADDEQGAAMMQKIFAALACGIALPPSVRVNGRPIAAVARASDAIWFSFAQLCGSALGQNDYLSLAERFATVLLSGTPKLDTPSLAEESRRFTWLVDILYDNRVTLVLSAADDLQNLYGTDDGGESGRTLSRLIEMQSPAYWRASLGSGNSAKIA